MPKPDVFGFIAPSSGSSVTAVAPLADSHLSNDASEPVAVPSKMYSKPRSGGGGVYCACAAEGAITSAMSAASAMRCLMGTSLPPVTAASLRRIRVPRVGIRTWVDRLRER